MELRKIGKLAGSLLTGLITKIEGYITFTSTANPELDSSEGDATWKVRTARSLGLRFRDDTKGTNFLEVNTADDEVTLPQGYKAKGFGSRSIAKAINYTAIDGDFVVMTTGASDKTITLPAAATSTDVVIEAKKVDSGAGDLIIDGNASETIDGATTQTLASQYDSIVVHCDGTQWWIK